MYFDDNETLFEYQLREQENKKQKKLDKQTRLQQKKKLIEEMKNAFVNNEIRYDKKPHNPLYETQEVTCAKGSLEWALHILNAKQSLSLDEIRKNYLQLVNQFHPDKNNGNYTDKHCVISLNM